VRRVEVMGICVERAPSRSSSRMDFAGGLDTNDASMLWARAARSVALAARRLKPQAKTLGVLRDASGGGIVCAVDDGTAVARCVFWTPSAMQEGSIQLGRMLRVQGRPSVYRGALQITTNTIRAYPLCLCVFERPPETT